MIPNSSGPEPDPSENKNTKNINRLKNDIIGSYMKEGARRFGRVHRRLIDRRGVAIIQNSRDEH
jgi:hypothetical protein